MRRIRPLGLFGRIYLLALFLLIAIVTALAIFIEVRVEGEDADETLALARWIVDDLTAETDPARRQTRINDFSERLDVHLAVFDLAATVIASSPDTTIAPLEAMQVERLAHEPEFYRADSQMIIGVFNEGVLASYVIVEDAGPIEVTLGFRSILVIALFLVVLSWPLARRLTRPIEELKARIGDFGAGDMAARVKSKRGDEIGDLARQFDAMADQVSDLIDKERQLLAAVSHEFRTPLQRLRLALDLFEDGEVASTEELHAVGEDIAELDHLVHDIMLSARLDRVLVGTDRVVMRRRNADFAELLESSRSQFSALHPARVLRVEGIGELGPCHVFADVRLLGRAVSNLLVNAHKYSPPDMPIEIEVTRESACIKIAVSDSGSGVPAAAREQIFEPFTRQSETGTGFGLGLALVRRVAELHEGSAYVESRAGGGSRFILQIPEA